MPKTKKVQKSSDSDSDSGPEDRNPPPKKAKNDGDTTKTDEKGNAYWQLDRNRRVALSNFKGKLYLNIREYFQDKSGNWCPGKNGITLTKNEWNQLLALQPEIKFDA